MLALGAGAGGCRSPARELDPEPQPTRAAARGPVTAPTWIRQPLSWSKLEALDAWLEEEADRHEPSLVNEARLQLGEGRLEFSRRDLDGGTAPPEAVRVRIAAAREGFEQVLADRRSTTGQRTRARIGVDAAKALLAMPTQPGLAILRRQAWNAAPARSGEMTPLRGQWSRITVHHSAENGGGEEGGSLSETLEAVRLMQKVHMDRADAAHGWADIGYHFLIDASGRILEGRDLAFQGAHARGVNNQQNLGVCLLGDFTRRAPSAAALRSLELLLADLRRSCRIPAARIFAHKELTATACPGASLSAWVERYRRADAAAP